MGGMSLQYNNPTPMNPTIPGAVASTTYQPPGVGPSEGADKADKPDEQEHTALAARPGAIFSVSLSVHLGVVGISLIVEKPVRRWVWMLLHGAMQIQPSDRALQLPGLPLFHCRSPHRM